VFRIFSLLSAVFFSCLLLANCARAQKVQHPLDALATQEYWTVYDVLTASGHLDGDTHFVSILLHEPAKSVVLAWKSGDAVSREADVVLLRKERVIEARVDIGARKVESWKEIPGVQGAVFESEILGLTETILADDRVKKALDRRGITDKNTVQCEALPVGFFAFPEQQDHRIGLADCTVGHGSYHTWSRYIGGLTVEVDFANGKVLQVFDEGIVPVPEPFNYEEAPGEPRPGTKPGMISQPLGPSFQMTNGEVNWQNWHFRFRLDSRVGPIVSLVGMDDGGRRRSVMYEGNMSELFVPYMDATRNWSTRSFLDAGEFYPGGVLKSLREGLDCPANAVYFDGLSNNEKGAPVLRPRQGCLFERFAGDLAWRHEDDDLVFGRPSRTLVLRSAAVIGNYDYLLDWRFEQDGSIRVAVGATGIIEARAVAAESVGGGTGHHDNSPEEYGQLVAKNLLGINHDHFFSFRLDLDVDGPNNSFMVHKLVQKELPAGGPRKSIWVAESSIAGKERDAMMDIHLEKPSMWIFVNPSVKGPLGHPSGYEIMPGVTAASLLSPEDGVQKVGAFSSHQLWVTPYKADELYAAGTYPNSSKGDGGLATWTRENRSIENTDLVAWYTLGFHHVPREEDWPVMPVMWHDFVIRPFDFFSKNPALDLPKEP
jgi:primary-amine oxidase